MQSISSGTIDYESSTSAITTPGGTTNLSYDQDSPLRLKRYVCYMRTIPHRELRNNSAAILRAVEAGESLTITNHGHAVAHLIPCGEKLPPLRSRRPVRPGTFESLEPVELDHPVQDSIAYLRGDR